MKNLIMITLVLFVIVSCGDNTNNDIVQNYETETEVYFDNNRYEIIDINGYKWLDRNLGAKEACYNIEGTPECFGDLYQWGRNTDGHQLVDSDISNDKLKDCKDISSEFIVNKIEGSLSSKKVLNEYASQTWFDNCDDIDLWNENGNGKNEVCPTGWHIASKKDFESLHITNPKDAFEKVKLVFAGLRTSLERNHIKSEVLNRGYVGEYWTSTISHNDPIYFQISKYSKTLFSISQMSTGRAIRCVKNVQNGF